MVEPGIVLDVLNAALRQHGLMFGPEPATHASCTLGGMIGNNSCGATAQALRQDGRQRRRAGGPDLRRDCALGRRDQRRGVRSDRRRGRPRAPRSTGAAGHRATTTPTSIRDRLPATSRAGSPATTSTRCCPSSGFDVARALVGSECDAGHRAAGRARARAGARGTGRWSCSASPTSPPPPTPCRDRRRTGPSRSRPRRRLIALEREQAPERGRAATLLPDGTRLADGRSSAATPRTRPTHRAQALIDALGTARAPSRRRRLRRPDARGASCGRSASPASAPPRTSAGRARHLRGLGGRRGRRPSGSATTCATCAGCSTEFGYARRARCTATSARAACTPASSSTSAPPTGSRPSARSSSDAADLVVSLRRLAVRRARRRPGPRRAAAEHVRRRAGRARSGEFKALFDPRRPDEPGQGRRAVPARREPAPGRGLAPARAARLHFALSRTTAAVLAARADRCVGVGKCRARRRRA